MGCLPYVSELCVRLKNQAREFHHTLGVTGLVVTKLDGTAKGGLGEQLDDLQQFDPQLFTKALFGEPAAG